MPTLDLVAHVSLGIEQVLIGELTAKLVVRASKAARQDAGAKLALERSRHERESAGLRQTLADSETLVKVPSTPLP